MVEKLSFQTCLFDFGRRLLGQTLKQYMLRGILFDTRKCLLELHAFQQVFLEMRVTRCNCPTRSTLLLYSFAFYLKNKLQVNYKLHYTRNFLGVNKLFGISTELNNKLNGQYTCSGIITFLFGCTT